MSEHIWVCKNCGKEFNPLKLNGDYSFNCPNCDSSLTVPTVKNEKKTPEEWEEKEE